jgi:hypothetical protein
MLIDPASSPWDFHDTFLFLGKTLEHLPANWATFAGRSGFVQGCRKFDTNCRSDAGFLLSGPAFFLNQH